MNKLSAEILKVNEFAQGLYNKNNNDKVVHFLISLDFLVKGVMTHWQIKLHEYGKFNNNQMMKDIDVKFPLLLGDQYHSIAYYIVSRLGNIELIRLLTLIEENFQKIFFNLELASSNFKENLENMYQHFYNYLPQFMGNSLKGVALIYEMDQEQIAQAFDLGVEMGYFYQFGVFSYIMTAIINKSDKAEIKEHLKKVSNML